jgi:hypothetical protein
MTDASGQSIQPMERTEGGDKEGGALTQGLSGVLVTLMKIAGITFFVLLIEKAFNQIRKRKWKLAQR